MVVGRIIIAEKAILERNEDGNQYRSDEIALMDNFIDNQNETELILRYETTIDKQLQRTRNDSIRLVPALKQSNN